MLSNGHPLSLLLSRAQQAHPATKRMFPSEFSGIVTSIAYQGPVGACARGTRGIQTRSRWLKKKGISTAAVAAASEPWMALRSMFSP